MKGIEIITSPKKARVLLDPMRREIVRLLAYREMTQNELAVRLGLSNSAVSYHLEILRRSGFIRVTRRRTEKHGIVEKFYRTSALVYLIDTPGMPLDIERYFTSTSLERVRGIVAAVSALAGDPEGVSAEEVEKFAKIMTSAILQIAPKHSAPSNLDREELIVLIYRNAFTYLSMNPDLLPDKARNLLLRARKRTRGARIQIVMPPAAAVSTSETSVFR